MDMTDLVFSPGFVPYEIQTDMARKLLQLFRDGGTGMFESPTGTGKSRSIIAGTLTWLKEAMRDGSAEMTDSADAVEDDGDSPDWVRDHFEESKTKSTGQVALRVREVLERRRVRAEERSRKKETSVRSLEDPIPSKKTSNASGPRSSPDEEHLLDDFDSDEDELSNKRRRSLYEDELGTALGEDTDGDSDEDEAELRPNLHKVIYCSRTHSQLVQFVNEIKDVVGSSGHLSLELNNSSESIGYSISVVTYASRRQTCINPKVRFLSNATAMNDACLDMQKKKSTKKSRGSVGDADRDSAGGTKRFASDQESRGACTFLSDSGVRLVRDSILTKVQDIEEIVASGTEHKACPYYGIRAAMEGLGQFLVMPYNALLHKATRESIKLDLNKNCIVIFDEAHNIIDSINEMYSTTLTSEQIGSIHRGTQRYFDRYEVRLHPKNRFYVRRMLSLLTKLKDFLETVENPGALRPPEFCLAAKIDNINIFKLEAFLVKTKFSQKLHGFMDAVEEGNRTISRSEIYAVVSFLHCLTNSFGDGRVLFKAEGGKGVLRYLMLNPSTVITPLVDSVRAVALVGGTLSPRTDLESRLLCNVAPERKSFHKWNHVVPGSNILGTILCEGPSGEGFDFRFRSRNSTKLIDELGFTVRNLCKMIPNGVILFFPSYEYEGTVYDRWNSTGFVKALSQQKSLMRERAGESVDALLLKYTEAALEGGAILHSVVGGKLSEGINFSDGLGRAVIIVGMPFPNSKDPETAEILKYLSVNGSGNVSDEYLEDSCMKAVNQSIGRCIRHRSDFASIIFLDRRYSSPRIRNKLPGWVESSTEVRNYRETVQNIGQFFRRMKDSGK